jgi:hypothetical protein
LKRVFRMSAINAIAEVRSFRREHGITDTRECCRLLRVRPDAVASFDYEAVESLDSSIAVFEGDAVGREQILRHILRELILHFRPPWGLLLQHGRGVVRLNAAPDVCQCFDSAGFFRDPPDEDSISWWDALSAFFRSTTVLGRVEVGRRGEALSLDSERRRLATAGFPTIEPKWAAIYDETLGYDLVSYDVSSGEPKPFYIEVKASERSPFAFFLTENEWKVAQAFKDTYRFHFWHLPTSTLRIVGVAEMEAHVPMNQGAGTWKKAQIVWP